MTLESDPLPVPALDLKAQYQTIKTEIDAAIRNVVENQMFVLGPEVSGLEAEIARYTESPHAVGCASGSDALLLPLMGWDVGPGDEVITTPYTFFATGGAIWRLGARPVFVDIDPVTYNLRPELIEAAITPRTKAIVPVHLYGLSADIDPIRAVAARHNLKVLEDAAQAIGARYNDRAVGSLADAAAFSFYPSKNLGGFGDGGMMTTADSALSTRLARLRVHGMEPRYYHHEVGFNSRLDALQAAVLRIKLKHLPAWTEARRNIAAHYDRLIAEYGLSDLVTAPTEPAGYYHVFNQYVVRILGGNRDELRKSLAEQKIGTEVYYPVPLHLQTCFASLGHTSGDFPQTELAAHQTLALPIYPELTEAAQATVIGAIAAYYGRASRGSAIPRPHIFRAADPVSAASTRQEA